VVILGAVAEVFVLENAAGGRSFVTPARSLHRKFPIFTGLESILPGGLDPKLFKSLRRITLLAKMVFRYVFIQK
jgi:hypothetical protein